MLLMPKDSIGVRRYVLHDCFYSCVDMPGLVNAQHYVNASTTAGCRISVAAAVRLCNCDVTPELQAEAVTVVLTFSASADSSRHVAPFGQTKQQEARGCC